MEGGEGHGGFRAGGNSSLSSGFCLGPSGSTAHPAPWGPSTLEKGRPRPAPHLRGIGLGKGPNIPKEESPLLLVQPPVLHQLLQFALQLQALTLAPGTGPQSRQQQVALPWLQRGPGGCRGMPAGSKLLNILRWGSPGAAPTARSSPWG